MNKIAEKLETGSNSGFQLLNQIEERSFEDIRKYRLYQLTLLESLDQTAEHQDIDIILREDSNYEPSEDIYGIDDEEWKFDQLRRASEKIVEEIETYNSLIEALEPEEHVDSDESVKQKEGHEKSLDDNSHTTSYGNLKRNLKIIGAGFSKLTEQSDMDYTEPFKKLDDHGLI